MLPRAEEVVCIYGEPSPVQESVIHVQCMLQMRKISAMFLRLPFESCEESINVDGRLQCEVIDF